MQVKVSQLIVAYNPRTMSQLKGAWALLLSIHMICFESYAQENPALSFEVETLFNTVKPIDRKKTEERITFFQKLSSFSLFRLPIGRALVQIHLFL